MGKSSFNRSISGAAVSAAALAGTVSMTLLFGAVSTAHAREIKLGGLIGRDQLRAACASVGGTSWSTSGRYGCVNDGKGTSITCTPGGECTAWIPRTQPGGRQVMVRDHRKPKSGGPLDDGILGSGSGMGGAGAPAATGSPVMSGPGMGGGAPVIIR